MQQLNGQYLFSATDLVAFLECEHLTELDLQAVQQPQWRAQRSKTDESAELIARKGNEHELAHLARLRAQGLRVVDVAEDGGEIGDRVARTRAAMESGADVVFQATLRDGTWIGHADFLMKVAGMPSTFGDWSYEVADTKLARSPKAKFLVQLAFYSHLLALAQGVAPRQMLTLEPSSAKRHRGLASPIHRILEHGARRRPAHADQQRLRAAHPYVQQLLSL